jgi:hypothetical protein
MKLLKGENIDVYAVRKTMVRFREMVKIEYGGEIALGTPSSSREEGSVRPFV